jgi:hypothetical protein
LREENKADKAIDFFKRAVKKNPFLWSAFEAICELGKFRQEQSFFLAFVKKTVTSDGSKRKIVKSTPHFSKLNHSSQVFPPCFSPCLIL